MDKSLKDICAALDTARIDHDRACTIASTARNDEASALNRLNAVQRDFDAAVAAIRKDASPGSDWFPKPFGIPV